MGGTAYRRPQLFTPQIWFYPQNLHDNTFILLLLKVEYSGARQRLA
jgi:hypothetical protein